MTRAGLIGGAVLLAAAAMLARAIMGDRPRHHRPPSLLVVTVDTWRQDHATPSVTPVISKWARRGWIFEEAWTPIGLTTPAHASLFTGLQPWNHGVRGNNHHGSVLDHGAVTLAEHLGAQGFRTAAFTSAWPAGPVGGLGRGFETFESPDHGERPGGLAVEGSLRWLSNLEAEERFFLWVHLFEPHGPYSPSPQDLAAVGGGDTDRDRYRGEVRAADRLLAPLLDHVHGMGSVLVAVTSDHGEVLDEELCGYQHERSIHPAVLRVPLFMWGPGVEPSTRTEVVSLVDVPPTLLALLNVPPIGDIDGHAAHGSWPGRALIQAESGLCEPDCAPGCSPEGMAGRDQVVAGQGWRVVRRLGRGISAEGAGAPPREDQALLFDEMPPAREPTGAAHEEQGRALGYLD